MKCLAPSTIKIALVLGLGILLSGCGNGSIGTSQSSYGNGISETTTVQEDGTYQQVFRDRNGHSLTNSDKWEQAQPMGLPGVPNDGSYIQLDNYVDGFDLKNGLPASAVGLRHTTELMPRNEFQPSRDQQAQTQSATLFWIVILRLALLVFWVYGIVDAARREFPSTGAKVGWVLVVVLLGCLGTVIYLLFGRSQGEIPGQGEEMGK